MALRLQRLAANFKIANPDGTPTNAFILFWQQTMQRIEDQVNGINEALAAAALADAAAANANAAAEAVTATTDIANSYPEGVAIGGKDDGAFAKVEISAHNRVYASGTTVAVDGGTITGLPYNTSYWIAYDQASRLGGAVTYQAFTTSQGNGVNDPNRHFIGALTTPEAGGLDSNGAPSQPPGGVDPPEFDGGALPP